MSETVDLSYIIEPLRSFAMPIDTLHEEEDNPRTHDERSLKVIANSLSEFGQRIPIVVQRDGMRVRVGNGRLRAARDILGWTHIAAIILDEEDIAASRFAIADNRTGELSAWDYEALAAALEGLGENTDLASLGFEDFDLSTLVAPTEVASSMDEDGEEEESLAELPDSTSDKDHKFVVYIVFNSDTQVDEFLLRFGKNRSNLGISAVANSCNIDASNLLS